MKKWSVNLACDWCSRSGWSELLAEEWKDVRVCCTSCKRMVIVVISDGQFARSNRVHGYIVLDR